MSMKIQFDANLDYQRDAIESVTGVFAGQEICQTNFTVAPLHSWEEGSLFHGIQEDTLGIGNRLSGGAVRHQDPLHHCGRPWCCNWARTSVTVRASRLA